MKSLGIDTSLTSTGFYLINEDGTQSGGCIKPGKMTGFDRISYIRNRVCQMVRENEPDVIVVEGYSFGSTETSISLAELGGAVRIALFDMNVKTVLCPPTTLKQFATDKGSGKKEEIKLGVWKRWGVEFPSNDETDAYVLSQYGLALLGTIRYEYFNQKDLSQVQLHSLTKGQIIVKGVTRPPPIAAPVRIRRRSS